MIDFFNILDEMQNIRKESSKTFDVTTDQGLKGFDEYLFGLDKDTIEVLDSFKSFFGIDENTDVLEGLSNLAHTINKAVNKKELKKEPERKVVDHTELNEDEDKKAFNRPSENLSVDQKLKLHKIVQEYVDTMIRPFNNGTLTDNQINDAYAGLYEFAAWVLNR